MTITAVPTFESIGFYFTPDDGSGGSSNICSIQFRVSGIQADWRDGLDLWWCSHEGEYRGSLLKLNPDTTYEISLTLSDGTDPDNFTVKTWSEIYPEGTVTTLDANLSQLNIDNGGSSSGYAVYDGLQPNGEWSIIDAANSNIAVNINATYVILRRVRIKNGTSDNIVLNSNNNILFEYMENTNWGRSCSDGYACNFDAGIYLGSGSTVHNIVVRYSHIHSPRYTSNAWNEYNSESSNNGYHPNGCQCIVGEDLGQKSQAGLICYRNSFYTLNDNYYNDILGGGNNMSYLGFPGFNSDFYKNLIQGAHDDGLELEGADANVRVWENYFDLCMVSVASCVCSLGPLYVWRNITARSFWNHNTGLSDSDQLIQLPHLSDTEYYLNRGYFSKTGKHSSYQTGKRYFVNNTTLQPSPGVGYIYTLGVLWFLETVKEGYDYNHTIKNNIMEVARDKNGDWIDCSAVLGTDYGDTCGVVDLGTDSDTNQCDYDLYNASYGIVIQGSNSDPDGPTGYESNGWEGIAIYKDGNGRDVYTKGFYQLDSTSLGYEGAEIIANINDQYTNPDIGAHEKEIGPMIFGAPSLITDYEILTTENQGILAADIEGNLI